MNFLENLKNGWRYLFTHKQGLFLVVGLVLGLITYNVISASRNESKYGDFKAKIDLKANSLFSPFADLENGVFETKISEICPATEGCNVTYVKLGKDYYECNTTAVCTVANDTLTVLNGDKTSFEIFLVSK